MEISHLKSNFTEILFIVYSIGAGENILKTLPTINWAENLFKHTNQSKH